MFKEKQYFVYILANKTRRLYVGVTGNFIRRIAQHKGHLLDGFTKKYNIDRLVYYEETNDVYTALNREKEIKAWSRAKKIKLIEKDNPDWNDLAENWDWF